MSIQDVQVVTGIFKGSCPHNNMIDTEKQFILIERYG